MVSSKSPGDNGFFYMMSEGKTTDDFRLYKGDTDPDFDVDEFEDFYPPNVFQIENPFFGSADLMTDTNFRPPFGGGAVSVTQISAISSAVVATMSPASPVTFSQVFSEAREGLRDALGLVTTIPGLIIFDRQVNRLYQTPALDSMAVCSQWPNPCGETDGMFMDVSSFCSMYYGTLFSRQNNH